MKNSWECGSRHMTIQLKMEINEETRSNKIKNKKYLQKYLPTMINDTMIYVLTYTFMFYTVNMNKN